MFRLNDVQNPRMKLQQKLTWHFVQENVLNNYTTMTCRIARMQNVEFDKYKMQNVSFDKCKMMTIQFEGKPLQYPYSLVLPPHPFSYK